MSEKKNPDSHVIHGLSIVDTTTNDTSLLDEDKVLKCKYDSLGMKTEDEVDISINHDETCEKTVAENSCLEEADEKINLFDILNEKEPEKENKDNFQNSTLIITTEEHLDTTTCDETLNTSTETVKHVKISVNETIHADSGLEELKKTPTKLKSKNEEHCYFWVSNITRHVKATDLKKFFSQVGKVVTVKILTNGKNYFGYVSVDSMETAAKCIKQLNNTTFDGKKIVVSKDRPDLRETKAIIKMEARRKKIEKTDLKKEEKLVEPKTVSDEKHDMKKNKGAAEEESKMDIITELKRKLDKSQAEVSRYKWKIVEYQRRHEGMRKKCSNLEKEIKEVQFKMRSDRRRLNQDREQFEKNKKMELTRLEADKAAVNKELAEVKKLRESLKLKIEEIKVQAKKNLKRRNTRSPPPAERSRSPRVRSPALRVTSRVRYRSNERIEKKRKREDPIHSRTPPPPKLSNGIGKKRGDNISHRQYFDDVQKRPSSLEHGYEYRHKPSFAPPQEISRIPWQTPYSKDPRRINAPPSSSQSYSVDPRYGAGYPFPQSSIAPPPRSYFPEFGKPYGHY